eukprot:scaffold211706_cov37-Tisochrysis_lutea.AAC.2
MRAISVSHCASAASSWRAAATTAIVSPSSCSVARTGRGESAVLPSAMAARRERRTAAARGMAAARSTRSSAARISRGARAALFSVSRKSEDVIRTVPLVFTP